ncbi:Multidrug resistance-associated protein 1 [Phytophthora ramorum]|uniref:Multidrug resistance-associated protein 1 n=1 Tax=Phytophthora ramorum TaxID=164328 RepID=UPI0030A2A35F|nr:Multidrug resistance-associated protein 1 [Phytophthora ramorum]
MIVVNSAFRKILRLSATARRTMDTGEIVTFVGVDSDRVVSAYKLGMWCIVAPLMLIAVSVLIGTQMGISVALAAAAAKVMTIYGALAMSKQIGLYRRQISRIGANRLKLTNEMLQGIRVVKFYGWEDFANELIHEIRQKEIGLLRKYNRLRLANTVLMFLAPTLLNLVCFTTTIALGNSLDVATTFVILALTNACRTPFSIFADASMAVAEAITSTSRLSDFLAAGESSQDIKLDTNREGNVQHQLLRLHVLLGDDEDQLDELYQSFQAADSDGRGSLKSTAEFESVLRKYLSPKDFKKMLVFHT